MFDEVAEPCTSGNRSSAEIAATCKKNRKGHVLLDELPEDVLDAILSYLDATTLYLLSQVSTRLGEIIKKDFLWIQVNARKAPNTAEKISYCLNRLNKKTTRLLLAGATRSHHFFDAGFLNRLKIADRLRILALEHQTLDGILVTLNDFPVTLEELSLKRSFITNHSVFFKKTCETMVNLRVLILDHCLWLDTETFLPLSRYKSLEILSVYMCKKLVGMAISYISLVGRFGFNKLRILNARFTGMGDQLLKSFWRHQHLQEIYFQDYHSTYQLDRAKRKLEILDGSPMEEDSYVSDDEASFNPTFDNLKARFGCSGLMELDKDNVTNAGIEMYQYAKTASKDEYVNKSVLYKDQYGECKCGFGLRFWSLPGIKSETPPIKSPKKPTETPAASSERQRILKVIETEQNCKVRPNSFVILPNVTYYKQYHSTERDKIPPHVLQPASTENKTHNWMFLRDPENDYEISVFEHTDVDMFRVLSRDVNEPEQVVLNITHNNNPTERPVLNVERIVGGPFNPNFLNRPLTVADLLGNNPANDSLEDEERRFNKLRESIRNALGPNNPAPSTSRANLDQQQPSTSKSGPRAAKIQVGSKRPLQEDDQQPSTSKSSPPQASKKTDAKRIHQEDGQRPSTSNSRPKRTKPKPPENKKKNPNKQSQLCNSYITIFTNFKHFFNPPHPTAPPQPTPPPPPPPPVETPTVAASGPHPVPLQRTKRILEKRRKFLRDFRMRMVRSKQRNDLLQNIRREQARVRSATRNTRVTVRILEPEQRQEEDFNDLQRNGSPVIRVLLRNDFEKDNYTQLKKLSFRGYKGVNDQALGVLTPLKLELLDVTGTSCTESGVLEFQVNNPQCRVLHECACICKPRMHF